MADASLDQRIMEKLRRLDDAAKRRVLDFIEEQTAEASEQAWEEHVLGETLGDAVRPDGSIDFDRLRHTGVAMTPEELYPV